MSKYDPNNIFAKMLRGEIPCDKVYEDDELLAFNDIAPAAPVHILVIPKGEFCSFDDYCALANEKMITHFFRKVKEIANKHGLQDGGYRLITNHGSDASQSVPHFHVHILGGRQLGGLVPNDTHNR